MAMPVGFLGQQGVPMNGYVMCFMPMPVNYWVPEGGATDFRHAGALAEVGASQIDNTFEARRKQMVDLALRNADSVTPFASSPAPKLSKAKLRKARNQVDQVLEFLQGGPVAPGPTEEDELKKAAAARPQIGEKNNSRRHFTRMNALRLEAPESWSPARVGHSRQGPSIAATALEQDLSMLRAEDFPMLGADAALPKKCTNDSSSSSTRGSSSSSSEDLGKGAKESVKMSTDTAWGQGATDRPRAAQSNQEMRRCLQGLLNRVCPENVRALAMKIKTETQITSAAELEVVIELIFKRALEEPHYCETFADLVWHLRGSLPTFVADGRKVTLQLALLRFCQEEFESNTLAPVQARDADGDLDGKRDNRTDKQTRRCLSNMRFIGNLFLRELLPVKVISTIMEDFVRHSGDEIPQEYVIECLCELLSTVGYTLESVPVGSAALSPVCELLQDLHNRKLSAGEGIYSRRVHFKIQDVLEIRAAGWTRRILKSEAKMKEEVRQQQARDFPELKCSGDQVAGRCVTGEETIVVGQRPAYLALASARRARA